MFNWKKLTLLSFFVLGTLVIGLFESCGPRGVGDTYIVTDSVAVYPWDGSPGADTLAYRLSFYAEIYGEFFHAAAGSGPSTSALYATSPIETLNFFQFVPDSSVFSASRMAVMNGDTVLPGENWLDSPGFGGVFSLLPTQINTEIYFGELGTDILFDAGWVDFYFKWGNELTSVDVTRAVYIDQ